MKWSLEQGEGAGEMVHCLGTLVALAEDQGFRESDELFGQPPPTHTHTYTPFMVLDRYLSLPSSS